MRRTSILCLILMVGCAGRDPNPVPNFRAGDDALTCNGIKVEMAYIDNQVSKLIPESKKGGKNAALGVAGWFLIVPWFFMDFSQAEKVEIRAYQERYLALEQLWDRKSCNDGEVDSEAVAAATAVNPVKPEDAKSIAERIEILDGLLREGAISQEEYDIKRSEILGEI